MKKFFLNIIAIGIIVVLVFAALLFLIPEDKNAYICEYNKKTQLIAETPSPRMIIMGSSTVAFNIDSKLIGDSLGMNVIDLGLNAMVGARFYLDDYLQYIRKGDIVVLCLSYSPDFVDGGNGGSKTLTELMVTTHWKRFFHLNPKQLWQVIEGVPFLCLRNVIRLARSPLKGFDTPVATNEFQYALSGFNEYGDEASHWTVPFKKGVTVSKPHDLVRPKVKTLEPNDDFMNYLKRTVDAYRQKGATINLLPEPSSELGNASHNLFLIEKALNDEGLQYCTNPKNMVFSDSYGYSEWGGAHFNRQGVTEVSKRIVSVFKGLSKSH